MMAEREIPFKRVEEFDYDLEGLKIKHKLSDKTFLEWLLGYVDYKLDLGGALNLKSAKALRKVV